MKEFYIAPEVKRLAFCAQEELAGGVFDSLLGAQENGGGTKFEGIGPETDIRSGDVDLPI